MEKIALFPGSFDPYTNGHHDIVLRGLKIFDKIIISIGHNTTKTRYFPLDTVIESIEKTYRGMEGISVVVYNELTAEFAKKHQAKYLLRGLRNTTDFEYENSISQVNRFLNDTLETVFLITSPQFAAINSSIIREVHKYGGDIGHFIPHPI